MILKISALSLLFLASLGFAGAAQAELLLSVNGIHFGPGDTLEVSVGFNDTETQTTPVDTYFAVLAPDGNTVFFISGNAMAPVITPGQITDPSTWTPLSRGVALKDIGDSELLPFLRATLPEDLPVGDYQIALATTRAGTTELIESQVVLMRILENSIASNIGYFVGSWENTTFDSTGAARFRIREVSPGILEYTIDLDGFVGGDDDPFPILREMPLADFTGIVDFEVEDPLFTGPVTNFLSPQGNYTYRIANVGIDGLGAFNATGDIGSFWFALDFQVNTTAGVVIGTVLAARQIE